MKIVVVSPVRDEELFIPETIKSMVNQTIGPVEWLIVDDGSTDSTSRILLEISQQYEWIHIERKPDRGTRAVGPGVVEAFYFGYERLWTQDYDYICKMDGDIVFGPHYFETLLSLFVEDPFLGAASGKPYLEIHGRKVPERTHDEMVAGQINFYRRQCFVDIGGFVHQVHWDGIAFHRARMKGWRTRSYTHPDLSFTHCRLMGSSHRGVLNGRLRWGKGQYFMGTHPLYILAIGLYRSIERPFLIGGATIIMGYLLAWITSTPRFDDPEFRRSLHAWQFERLKLGRRIESIPPPHPSREHSESAVV